MAQIFKYPAADNKGIISFTHNEWNWFFESPETHSTLSALKQQFYLGFNAAIYHGTVNHPNIIDFCFSSPSLIRIENGHTLNIPWLDRNFLASDFKDLKIENRFYDIITVSRAIKFKHVLDLLKALRVLFDRGKYYNTLLVIPTPENENDGRFDTNLVDFTKENFTFEERKYISLCKLAPELGFLGMSQKSIGFLYNNSKVVYKGSEGEGTRRALHEGILCGCTAVYYKLHQGALVDYLTPQNSVAFTNSKSHPKREPWNSWEYDIAEIADCLEKAVESYPQLKPDTDALFKELGDANVEEKLVPWFSKLYERDGVQFDGNLINLDNLSNRLCAHHLEDPWAQPSIPSTAITTLDQLAFFIDYINKNKKNE